MNVELEWSTTFLGIAAYEDRVFPNVYAANFRFITQTDDTREQNIAFERFKFMLREMFNDGVFVGSENPMLPKLFELTPNKIIVLPEESFDQIIAVALLCKLNAVMEGRIILEEIKLSSAQGDNIWYSFDIEDELGAFAAVPTKNKKFNKGKPWWHRPDIMTFDAKGKFEVTSWEEIGLVWEEPKEETVIEVELDDELAEAAETKGRSKVIDIKSKKLYTGFAPEIVDGGKTKADED